MKPWIIALTGASGTVYGIRLVQVLTTMGYEMALVISDSARLVIREEQGIALRSLTRVEDLETVFGSENLRHVKAYSYKDFSAPIASGSYPVEGMVIMPCSMGTLGSIASGISQNLIHRAADCVLKEGKKLILVPRETPLHAIHLENMLKLARMGAHIVPAMPAFYSGATQIEEMIDFMVGKVLDRMGIVHTLYPRWTGILKSERESDL